jgi:hypothetical protein
MVSFNNRIFVLDTIVVPFYIPYSTGTGLATSCSFDAPGVILITLTIPLILVANI